MEIGSQKQGDIDIVKLTGNLDTSTAADAENYFTQLVEGGSQKVLVNCTNLEYISSSGLRVFLVVAKALKETSGELRLCNLNEMVSEVFEISGFDTIFHVSPTEQKALEDF